jgi:hypothetical protein
MASSTRGISALIGAGIVAVTFGVTSFWFPTDSTMCTSTKAEISSVVTTEEKIVLPSGSYILTRTVETTSCGMEE